MSQSQSVFLERELVDSQRLHSQIHETRLRMSDPHFYAPMDGFHRELQAFMDQIHKRLKGCGLAKPGVDQVTSFWNWIDTESNDPREQVRILLSGYVRYETRTVEAIRNLEWCGDFESSHLLHDVLEYIERCLCFLEMYLEELALSV